MKSIDVKTKAFNIANEANLSEEELELQHKKKEWIYIQKSSIEQASKASLLQGESNAKTEIVLNAHHLGLPIQTICQLTGLDEESIRIILSAKR